MSVEMDAGASCARCNLCPISIYLIISWTRKSGTNILLIPFSGWWGGGALRFSIFLGGWIDNLTLATRLESRATTITRWRVHRQIVKHNKKFAFSAITESIKKLRFWVIAIDMLSIFLTKRRHRERRKGSSLFVKPALERTKSKMLPVTRKCHLEFTSLFRWNSKISCFRRLNEREELCSYSVRTFANCHRSRLAIETSVCK